MSKPEMRLATEAELECIEMLAPPFIDALQSLAPPEAMSLLAYITARIILDLKPKPGISHVEGFDVWAKSVRTTIEYNAAMHNRVAS